MINNQNLGVIVNYNKSTPIITIFYFILFVSLSSGQDNMRALTSTLLFGLIIIKIKKITYCEISKIFMKDSKKAMHVIVTLPK